MFTMSSQEFWHQVEKILEHNISTNTDTQFWDEDYITLSVVKGILNTFGQGCELHLSDPFPARLALWDELQRTTIKIEWSAFKNRGNVEEKFGDLAILVNTSYSDGDVVEGVAFFEAKKRYQKSQQFDAIKWSQVDRILHHAPHFSLLLYDYAPVCFSRWQTYAVTVPGDLVMATMRKDTALYKFSAPFSDKLLWHLLGFDLERLSETIEIAKGKRIQYGIPKYLLVASIGVGDAEPSKFVLNSIVPDFYSYIDKDSA